MNFKGVLVTCTVVILYLSLCSWRFQRLDESQAVSDKTLVINVNK